MSHIAKDTTPEKLLISSDLKEIFKFLEGIDNEVTDILNVNTRLKTLGKGCSETLNFSMYLLKKLEENGIELDSNCLLPKNLELVANAAENKMMVRSQMLTLFASLETLRSLWTAYDLKITDKVELRKASDEAIDKFIKEFCLCKENSWYSKNKSRAGKIGVKSLRDLRNSLTHFFSTPNLALVETYTKKDAEYAKKTNNKYQAFSPTDLYEIIKGSVDLIFKRWCTECMENIDFQEKIACVITLVRENASVIIREGKMKSQKN